MTTDRLEREIQEAIPKLLGMARELTWNRISDNCKFILSEIINTGENFHEQRRLRNIENDQKTPMFLNEIIPALRQLYNNLYDINLCIHKAMKDMTVIDIRYYPKSSLDDEYRFKVLYEPPMLHCNIKILIHHYGF